MLKEKHIPTPLIPDSERNPILIAPLPSRSRFRAILVPFQLGLLLVGVALIKVQGKYSRAEFAARLREFFEKMGGLWIKVGQLLAMRSDKIPRELCLELSKLQDRSYGFEPRLARQIIEDNLGLPLPLIFSEFDDHPIAAASIGQIHRARLLEEGHEVAIKVQRPTARANFQKDLALIDWITWIFARIGFLPNMRWSELGVELRRIMEEELDYRSELTSISRMRQTLKEHRIFVPRAFEKYSTDQVLVMEYFRGVLMSDYIAMAEMNRPRLEAWLEENEIRPRKLGVQLVRTIMRQMMEDNLFHGDLHPGNIMLFRKSRIGFIDFGSVGSLDSEFLAKYNLYLQAMGMRQYGKAADMMLMLTQNLPPIDLQKVKEEFIRVMTAWENRAHMKSVPYHEKSLANASEELNKVLFKYKLEANWSFLKLGRAWGTLDASLSFIDPKLNYIKAVSGYYKQARWRAIKKSARELAALPSTVAELMSLVGPILRQKAIMFRATSSKLATVMATFLRMFSAAAIIGVIFAVWVGMHHWFNDSGFENAIENAVVRLFGRRMVQMAESLPRLTFNEWLLMGTGLLILSFIFLRCVKILSSPDYQRDANKPLI